MISLSSTILGFDAYATLAILLVAAVFFVSGKVRADLVAVCSLVLLITFGILSPKDALSGFSNPVVIMMLGLFIVGGAIFQTGLAKMISSYFLKLAGDSEIKLLIIIMLVTASIGAFVSNTGTVALMLPIVISLAMASNKINISRLLMPMAFASSLGGVMTLIGTPPNLVIDEVLIEKGYPQLTFFSFTSVGVIGLVVGMLVIIPLSKILIKKKEKVGEGSEKNDKTPYDLVREYKLSKNLYKVQVQKDSPFVDKSLKELHTTEKYHINILEIRHKSPLGAPFFESNHQEVVNANSVIYEGDILYTQGKKDDVQQLIDDNKLQLLELKGNKDETEVLKFSDIGIAEVLVMPASKLVNVPVKKSRLREHFGLNILGIQRQDTYLLQDIKDEKIHTGDILLVQGTWDNIVKLGAERSQLVVLGHPLEEASKVTLTHKAPIAAVIMIAMVVAMMFDFIPIAPVTAVIIASILMVVSGALRNVEAAYQTINWESLVLIAGMLPMAMALEKTGVSHYVSEMLAQNLGNNSYILLAGIYFTTSVLTLFISNTATAVLLAPIAFESAVSLNFSPYPFLFAVAVAASLAFASPFATPPNALVMSAGRYKFMDYVKLGLPLQIIVGIIMIFVLPLIFPLNP
ncbi:SLC13 family permease [Capnocytophaga canis]|uniref:SLC13 family permease n=1 Tax=Capnocytophaga canis TaxID=1848903 RepID=UPI001561FF7C|nr:SLC13 family permease [Capnocytophaga canis]